MTTLYVTAQKLIDRDACRRQVLRFERLFGAGAAVRVTKALCIKHANDFDFAWAGMNLLTPAQRCKWWTLHCRAYEVYHDAVHAAYGLSEKEYTRTLQQAHRALKTARALAFWEGSKARCK